MRSKVFREHAPFVYFLLDGLLVRFTPRALEQAATRSWVLLGGRSSSCVFFHVAATAPFGRYKGDHVVLFLIQKLSRGQNFILY
jgi:hypothetical protein